jgi:hypothetical protein
MRAVSIYLKKAHKILLTHRLLQLELPGPMPHAYILWICV